MASQTQGKLTLDSGSAGKIWRPLVHVWYRLFRNDIFISYTRNDAGCSYAHALAVELQERNFDILMDTLEARQSADTPEALLNQMCCCMQMVIVASAGAVGSTEITREIELFPKKGRSIVLLEFDQNVRSAKWYKDHLVGLTPVPALEARGKPNQGSTLQPIKCAEELFANPKKETVDLIVNAFKFKRQRLRQAAIATLTGVITILLVIASTVLFCKLAGAGAQINQQRETIQQQDLLAHEQTVKNAQLESQRVQKEEAFRRSEAAFKEQRRLTNGAIAQRLEAEKKRDEMISLRDTAEKEREMAATRLAVTDRLGSDPVLAYRLAEYAYKRSPDTENKHLLLSAASRSRFHYEQVFRNCDLQHVAGNWALLVCGKNWWEYWKEDHNEVWKVVYVQNGKVEHEFQNDSSLHYLGAWVVPHERSWRVIAVNRGPVAGFIINILDASGLLKTIEDQWWPAICGSDRLIVHLGDLRQVTLLDAHTGELIPIPSRGDHFVSCKPDGAFIVSHEDKVEMFDRDGSSLGKKTYPVGGEYAPAVYLNNDLEHRYKLSWSPDGKALALLYPVPGGGRLHILDPVTPSFTSLTPSGFVDTAYAWEGEHSLVVAGHTLDQTDFSIAAIDALKPVRSLIQRSPAVVSYISALGVREGLLNGARVVAYDSGVVNITQAADGNTLWSGQHPGANKFAVVGEILATSSSKSKDVRLWQINPPTSHWVFRSTESRRYISCAAGDPTFRWQAVAFSVGQAIAVEVRSVTGVELRSLDLPTKIKGCNLAFSQDGRWLTAVGKGGGMIFDTKEWKSREIPLDFPEGANIWVGADRMLLARPTDAVPFGTGKDYEVEVDLTGEIPRFGPRSSNTKYGFCGSPVTQNEFDQIREQSQGWEPILAASPADRRLHRCQGSGWIEDVFIRADVKNQGWVFADVEFIPSDPEGLLRVYAGIMPEIPENELRSSIWSKPVHD